MELQQPERDDQIIITWDEENLSYLVRKLEEEYNKTGLEINMNKTDYLTAQETIRNREIEDGREIRRMDIFQHVQFIIPLNE